MTTLCLKPHVQNYTIKKVASYNIRLNLKGNDNYRRLGNRLPKVARVVAVHMASELKTENRKVRNERN